MAKSYGNVVHDFITVYDCPVHILVRPHFYWCLRL